MSYSGILTVGAGIIGLGIVAFTLLAKVAIAAGL
jgi:hypothetical protein